MEYSTRHTSASSSRSSIGPIEIPLSAKARRCSPHAPHACSPTTPSPDLLFEMSPLDSQNSQSSSPSCRSFHSTHWRDNELDSFIIPPQARVPSRPSSPQTHRINISSSSLSESFASSHAKHARFRNSVNNTHNIGLATPSAITDSVPPTTPPIIKTTAIHKICGFNPDPETLPKTPECHDFVPQKRISALTMSNSSRPTLSPASGSPVVLPWLLPGSRDDDEDYLSCASQSFDFKKFLLYRLDKGRMRGIRA
ncbi:hypothetical protein WG66_013719 [Moniliophthora roreri]|uniref:Uncharacterized protein n=1 Tax=Moniliophthora roreri TaxID=221103 RepID=A0A0W0G091_MONRR|nr:hypothetical protein WG66_013719 [Moniliophthora roreri]